VKDCEKRDRIVVGCGSVLIVDDHSIVPRGLKKIRDDELSLAKSGLWDSGV
jgi:hypothetical protein